MSSAIDVVQHHPIPSLARAAPWSILPAAAFHQGHRRMDSRVPASTAIPTSLANLSPELLYTVFEQLYALCPASLLAARLTSWSFYNIATPFFYREIRLSPALLNPAARRRWPRVFEHIARHTNHVILQSDLDPDRSRQVISSIKCLLSVRWICVPKRGSLGLISQTLNHAQLAANGTRVYVEDLPIGHGGDLVAAAAAAAADDDDDDNSFFCEFVTSIKARSKAPHLTTRPEYLKALVMRCPRLTTFRYEDRGQGTSFSFTGAERLPPLTELTLKSYDWIHDGNEVARHWNFSRLRVLKLRYVPMYNFLVSVRFSDLANLRVLCLEDFSAHHSDQRGEATRALSVLVGRHVRALEELSVVCHARQFDIKALEPHGNSLRVLRLRDHVGFGDETRHCPTVSVGQMRGLAEELPRLHTLEVDLDSRVVDTSAFLEALGRFPCLHTVVLHVQTGLSILDVSASSEDVDRNGAMRMFQSLVKSRSRAWRSITINVGGWRPVMIRRLAEGWRELNRRGIFAERCFVLERTEDGSYSLCEERGLETASPSAVD